MKIWLLTVTDPQPLHPGVRKMRTPMLAQCLAQAGHEVMWWTNSFCHFQKDWVKRSGDDFVHEGIRYRFLRGRAYQRNISLGRYLHYKLMAQEFAQLCRQESTPDLIFASLPDYDLPFAAGQYAREKNIPFLVDVRDLWPFEIKRQVFPFNLPGGKYLLSYEYYKVKKVLRQATAVTAVSERMLSWAQFHRQRANKWDRVFYLGHPGHEESDRWADKIKAQNEKVTFVYVGSFNNQHNLDLIIETAQRLEQEHYNRADFLLIGDGEHYQRIKRKARWLTNVRLTGWQNAQELSRLLGQADVGLVPIKSGDYFLPNKPFEYLSQGLPILSTLEGDMRAFLEGHQVGLTCSAQNGSDFGRYIKELTENHQLRQRLSQNARHTFQEKFSAQIIYSQFVQHLEDCLSGR